MSDWMEERYPRWFVSEDYSPSGRPKLETELTEFAKQKFLYRIVDDDNLDQLELILADKQERIYEANRRLKKVRLVLGPARTFSGKTFRFLYIGDSYLTLTKVRGEV